MKLNNTDVELIKNVFTKQVYKKGEFLIEEGKRSNQVYFIESGLVRMYFINENGNEMNTYFASDASFITSYASFINQHASIEFLKAEKDTVVYALDYTSFIANNDFMLKFRALFAEQNLVCIKNRLDVLQNSDAQKKYEYFIQTTNQEIINGIPLYHIASYLGITAESLSRIRKKTFLTISQEI